MPPGPPPGSLPGSAPTEGYYYPSPTCAQGAGRVDPGRDSGVLNVSTWTYRAHGGGRHG